MKLSKLGRPQSLQEALKQRYEQDISARDEEAKQQESNVPAISDENAIGNVTNCDNKELGPRYARSGQPVTIQKIG